MGCGSSSLKGEKVEDIKADQPQPIKKVKTNFSEVDFTGESGGRRGTVAVAPDEQRRPTRISETAETGGLLQTRTDTIAEEEPVTETTAAASAGETTAAATAGKETPAIDVPETKPASEAAAATTTTPTPTTSTAAQAVAAEPTNLSA